jgi:hypothetical protein
MAKKPGYAKSDASLYLLTVHTNMENNTVISVTLAPEGILNDM